ncbi:MAG: bifunctional diaminohydroxyphosphoribosylaminopyrimidine deaminase/5-amino-6-(5-phosphoribosylamino)uracil reductase RibD [Bacteroidetes bacterium]|nr:bifunctional diaminohydroxyphosphoribosylaminopyrimidine deaminase/5-amino-6-(5-phosphoribosylamino)uracil reductase RibD [Bacteroidota bacterium]
MTNDETIMKECIRLAAKGRGFVSPNPLVGSVIIKDNKIIGKGFHKKYGEAHAEVNAVIDAEKNGYSVKGASIYVNLEPCAHHGKTPSCAELIAVNKFREAVIGMQDPYREVNGRGIEILKNAGIKIKTGVLENECRELNRFFVKFVTRKLPYVTLKIAQSIDGKIALNNFESKYITGGASGKIVHRLRSEYDAVLIGRNTALRDDPSLDVRNVKGRNPLRIVIDRRNNLPEALKIFSDNTNDRSFVIADKSSGLKKSPKNLLQLKSENNRFRIKDILKLLYKFNLNSILVEGGSDLFSQFLSENLFDDIYLFIAPKVIGRGLSAFDGMEINTLNDSVMLETEKVIRADNDILIKYKKCSQA